MSQEEQKISREFGIYAVKDELTGIFHQPIFIETKPEAERWFKYVLNENGIWKSNASMYNFYKIGYFHEAKGIKTSMDPELICGGLSVKEE